MQSLHGNQFVQLSASMDRLLGIQREWERPLGPDLLPCCRHVHVQRGNGRNGRGMHQQHGKMCVLQLWALP